MLPGSSRLYSQTLGNVAAEAAGRAQAGRSQKTGACSETAVRIRTFIISRAHRTEGLFDFLLFAQMPNGLPKLFFLTGAAVTSCVRLDAGWQMQRASDVAAPGSSVATRDADTRGWLNVTLPCTVLGCLQQQVTR